MSASSGIAASRPTASAAADHAGADLLLAGDRNALWGKLRVARYVCRLLVRHRPKIRHALRQHRLLHGLHWLLSALGHAQRVVYVVLGLKQPKVEGVVHHQSA